MIKSRPIQRNLALVRFSKDHHFALLLIWKVRQGIRYNVEPRRINNYINFFFENYLKEHFTEEEELLFVHLDPANPSRIIAEKDHKTLMQLIEEINSHQENNTLYSEFISRLEKHIRFEERALFNDLQNTLSDSVLNSIGERMDALHPDQKVDNWKDTFWLKN